MTLLRQISWTAALTLSVSSVAGAQQPSGRGFSFDVGALGYREIRISVEPLRIGHVSFLATFSWSDQSRGGDLPAEAALTRLGASPAFDRVSGEELSLDVGARYYATASRAPRFSYAPYLGASVGAHQRSLSQWCFSDACPAILLANTQASGFEPAAEAGVRFQGARGITVDVGIRARVVTFSDPVGSYHNGDIDPKASVSVGFNW